MIESLAPAGAEQVLLETLPAMANIGVVGDVAVLWPPYDLAISLRERGTRVQELDIPSTWSVRRGRSALQRLAAEGQYDLIHAHLPMAVFYSAIVRGPVPVVATFHGLSFEYYPASTIFKKMRRIAERWWTNHCIDSFIAVSCAVADHYSQVLHIPREKIEIIPNGFPVKTLIRNPALDVPSVRRTLGFAAEDFLLLHVGRFVRQKGHMHLLRAVQELTRRGLKFKLLLLGQGPMRAELESFLGLHHLDELVKICAPVSHPELLKVLQASDLFVFPSVSEGFGMAAGEAMCMGVPVVASNLPGIASLIEDEVSGVLVPPGDPEALATAIERLATDPATRYRLAAEARKRIEQEFSIEKIALKIANVYRRLLRID